MPVLQVIAKPDDKGVYNIMTNLLPSRNLFSINVGV